MNTFPPPNSGRPAHKPVILVVIGIFKLLKAALLFLVGFGLFRLLHQADMEATLDHWVNHLRVDPNSYHIHNFIARVVAVDPHTLHYLQIGTFIYAGLYTVEGIGLILARRWAEWVTIISTALFVPLEIYEIYRHASAQRVTLLVVNVLVLIYLIYRIRKTAGEPRGFEIDSRRTAS